jgi:hypothetical protein
MGGNGALDGRVFAAVGLSLNDTPIKGAVISIRALGTILNTLAIWQSALGVLARSKAALALAIILTLGLKDTLEVSCAARAHVGVGVARIAVNISLAVGTILVIVLFGGNEILAVALTTSGSGNRVNLALIEVALVIIVDGLAGGNVLARCLSVNLLAQVLSACITIVTDGVVLAHGSAAHVGALANRSALGQTIDQHAIIDCAWIRVIASSRSAFTWLADVDAGAAKSVGVALSNDTVVLSSTLGVSGAWRSGGNSGLLLSSGSGFHATLVLDELA